MKKKLFILFALVIFSSSLLANPVDSRRRIELKVKHKIERRSILPSAPTVFISGTLLEINLNSSYNRAIIVITNNYTGEEVYHEESIHEASIIIDLYDVILNCTEYSLYILVDENTIINGHFAIE